jgi:hypothetical protein
MNTLTDMLNDEGYDFIACEIETIKDIFKAWLKGVAIGTETPETKAMRSMLITLVDEP